MATRELTRIGIVLSPRSGRRRWLAGVAWVASALAIGAAGGYLYWSQHLGALQQPAGALEDNQALQHRLEQNRLTASLAQSRSQELERQIDALNQRLRESQEELAFFRKARGGKH